MIKFDFNTYVDKFIDDKRFKTLMGAKDNVIRKFQSCEMIGWTKEVPSELITRIKETAEYIKNNFDCLVIIGIGGSFLGSYAFHQMFKKYFKDSSFEIIYVGTTLSSKYIEELMDYLKDKNYCIDVISKSGSTMETTIFFELLKENLKRKYHEEEVSKHIIVTTDKEKGPLREEANKNGYISFEIPQDIGGRYSFITPAHLLPIAINYDIDEVIDGYYHGKRLIDYAYHYAVIRKMLFDNNKYIENFCISEQNLTYFTEWLKQLFGETEGKKRVGIFPTSSIHTRDLHSLGQFIQDGNKIVFETYLKIDKVSNYINYQGRNLHELNNIVEDSVMKAHYMGDVPCLDITLDKLNIKNITTLIYFFQLSASFSAFLFGVEPFNQPGVEIYKEVIKESLKG